VEHWVSVDLLRLIPTDQNYIPDSSQRRDALALLKTWCPDADEIEATVYDKLTFIDQGENCEAVLCPSCNARMRTNEGDRWWWDLTEEIYVEKRSIAHLRVTMPCCAADIPFPSLRFDWPAGFAHFELCVQNPGLDDNLLAPVELRKLEDVLNCKLMQIRTHY
jgi:hypothetical protein